MFLSYYLLNLLTIISTILVSIKGEPSLEASLDFFVEGNGFHRKVHYNVDFASGIDLANCHLAIYVDLPTSLYVNIDELADLQRLGENTVCSSGEINVELFAENAGHQQVTICSLLNPGMNNLSVPIHQRYHAPLEDKNYINVTLPKAKLLLGCKQRLRNFPVSKIDLCSPCVDLSIKWREITYKTKSDEEYIWTIPVGNITDKDWIILVTIGSSLLGTVFVLKALWQSSIIKTKKTN